jgi:transcriptional regulator with XRE-family HTH domain
VGENWTAVAREVNSRATSLGLKQRELAERSGVSAAIVREIQQGRIHRRRNPRTLEALSIALQWHPQHLTAVLAGIKPPENGHTAAPTEDPVLAALTTLVREVRGLRAQIGTLSNRIESVVNTENGNRNTSR